MNKKHKELLDRIVSVLFIYTFLFPAVVLTWLIGLAEKKRGIL